MLKSSYAFASPWSLVHILGFSRIVFWMTVLPLQGIFNAFGMWTASRFLMLLKLMDDTFRSRDDLASLLSLKIAFLIWTEELHVYSFYCYTYWPLQHVLLCSLHSLCSTIWAVMSCTKAKQAPPCICMRTMAKVNFMSGSEAYPVLFVLRDLFVRLWCSAPKDLLLGTCCLFSPTRKPVWEGSRLGGSRCWHKEGMSQLSATPFYMVPG